MKIVHVAASAPYNDYWGYQDNLLPKYHAKLGHDVTMLTTNTKHENGEIIEIPCADYRLTDGVRVIRFKRKDYGNPILNNLTNRIEIFDTLKEIHPDFIFFHGLVSDSIYDVVKYKKAINPNCIIVQDNHLDYNIGRDSRTVKDKIIRAFQRRRVKRTISFVNRVFGVTPWRMKYVEDYFQVPTSKTDVLIMGADDEEVDIAHRIEIREHIREKFKIPENAFLIVTGGKIDEKKKIHYLMDAVGDMEGVKLLIFGAAQKEFEIEFNSHANINTVMTGWIPAADTYKYLLAADLVFFPGQHSVLWEQACACKVPCVFAQWEGMGHVDNGGNSSFLELITVDSIRNEINRLHFTNEYYKMKSIAESEATDIYLYSEIAKKSLEIGINARDINSAQKSVYRE